MVSFASQVQKQQAAPVTALQSAFTNPSALGFKPVDNPDAGAQMAAGVGKIEHSSAALGALNGVRAELKAQEPQQQAEPGTGVSGMVFGEGRNMAFFGALDMITGSGVGAMAQAVGVGITAAGALKQSLMGMGSDAVIATGARTDDTQYGRERGSRDEPSAFESMASSPPSENLLATGGFDPFADFRVSPESAGQPITLAKVDELINANEALLRRGMEEAAGMSAENIDAIMIANMGSFADEKADPAGGVKTRDLRPDMDFQRQFQPAAYAPAFA